MNFLIFHNFLDFILIFHDLFNRAGPAKVTWRDADTWGATQAHMDAYVVPAWREQWYRTVGIKPRNRMVGIKSRDWAVEITRSGIRVMGHDPTGYARSDGWNYTEWNPRHEPRSHLFRAVRRLKAHGAKSTSWATIPQFHEVRRLKSHRVKSASWATIHKFCTNFSINRCSLPL